MIYLIHFHQKLSGHAQHYIGYCADGRLEERLQEHRTNQGARILRACNLEGIDYEVVRTVRGNRKRERLVKNQKKARAFCPVCSKHPKPFPK